MINIIAEKLNERGIKAEVHEANKNGVIVKGVLLGDGEVKPCYYVKDVEEDEIDEVVSEIEEFYDNTELPRFSIEYLKEWESIKDKLILCLGMGAGVDVLQHKYLDMTLYVRIDLPMEDATVVVKKDMAKMWGVTEDEIFNQASKNTLPKIKASNILLPFIKHDVLDMDFDTDMLYVLSTKDNYFGASAMYYRGLLQSVADKMGTDFYIIPSSIHEVIVVSNKNWNDPEGIKSTVRGVNASQVAPEDRLSDTAYIFNRETCEVKEV